MVFKQISFCHISQFCLCNDNTKTVQSQYSIYKYWPFVQSVGTALTEIFLGVVYCQLNSVH